LANKVHNDNKQSITNLSITKELNEESHLETTC
jgi:hypothetical protein